MKVWFDRRTNYTRSLAVMSMVGYVLGLGDRYNLLLTCIYPTIVLFIPANSISEHTCWLYQASTKVAVAAVVVVRLSLRAVSHSTCCAFYVIKSKFVTSPRSFTKPRTGRTVTGQKPAYIIVLKVAFYGETTAYRRTYYFLPLSRSTNVFRPSLSSVII